MCIICCGYNGLQLNLTIHTKRGRPTNTEKLKTDKQTKADLRKLRKEMNYKDGTEILLALSVATDEMARHVQMFPEVFISMLPLTQTNKNGIYSSWL